jgi:disulfide bond formation protein DsbB
MGTIGIALIGTLGSLFLSLGMGLKACPLCFYQRTFVMAALVVATFGLWAEPRRSVLVCWLVMPLAWAGLGVAAFHESLVINGKLECPAALFGLGTAPAQSLILFVVLTAATTFGAWSGRGESSGIGGLKLLTAVVVGGAMAWACVASAPPLPPTPKQAYDPVKQPLDMCRPPFHGG